MKELERTIDRTLGEIAKIGNEDEWNMDCLHVLDKLADILKDLSTADAMLEEFGYDQYQDNRYSRNDGSGYSNRRMGGGGRYSSYGDEDWVMNSNSHRGGYYRNGRYGGYSMSDGKSGMISTLENMMHDTRDDATKDELRRLLDKMKNQN